MRIDPSAAALLLVDVQERLAAAMDPAALAACERNLGILVELGRRLKLPIVLSEQYPKGLGPTVASLRAALEGAAVERIEKMDFSCATVPAFREVQRRLARPQWIVGGMETHVCVYQTARDLAAGGAQVHVPADAVLSRTAANREIGLGLIARAGAIVTATETVVFDALQTAGTDDFRALSKLIK